MMRSDRYDRDRPRHHHAAPRGGRYTHEYDRGARYRREYDGGHRRAHESGYTGPEYRHTRESGYAADEYRRPARSSAPALYTDDFRSQYPSTSHRAAAPRQQNDYAYPPASASDTDTRWAAPSHRRRREHRGPWRRGWQPEEWWHAIGPEPRADYDWAYEARRPERYGWTGETGRG
jgi:hypothetical protein